MAPPNISGIDEGVPGYSLREAESQWVGSGGPGCGEDHGVEAAVCVGGVEVRRVEVGAFFDAEPFQQILVFGMGGVGEGVEEFGVAVDTAAVFRWTGAGAGQAGGVSAA